MEKLLIQLFFELTIHLSGIGSIADFADFTQSQSERLANGMDRAGFQGASVTTLTHTTSYDHTLESHHQSR